MGKLITICEKESQAEHLAFLLGIPISYILPFTDSKKLDLINPEATGGFVTYIKPYPANVIELKTALLNSKIGKDLILLEFDANGKSQQLQILKSDLDMILSKYQYLQSNKVSIMNDRIRKFLDVNGLTFEKGFKFRLIDQGQNCSLLPDSPLFELLNMLLRFY